MYSIAMYTTSPALPASYTVTMLGWLSAPAARAS
jgi:hypothetical protein